MVEYSTPDPNLLLFLHICIGSGAIKNECSAIEGGCGWLMGRPGIFESRFRESGCKFALSPPTVGRKTQIYSLIHTNPDSQIPPLLMGDILHLGPHKKGSN